MAIFLVHNGAQSRRQTLDSLPIIAGDIARVYFHFKAFSLDKKCRSRSKLFFPRLALEASPPRCSAAVYDNVCMFTALIVISVLAGVSHRKTLVLPLGRRLEIPTDSALKIFAFIYSVGESKFRVPALFSAVFIISTQKWTLKNRFLYVFRPQTNSKPTTNLPSKWKILKNVQQVCQNNFYSFN